MKTRYSPTVSPACEWCIGNDDDHCRPPLPKSASVLLIAGLIAFVAIMVRILNAWDGINAMESFPRTSVVLDVLSGALDVLSGIILCGSLFVLPQWLKRNLFGRRLYARQEETNDNHYHLHGWPSEITGKIELVLRSGGWWRSCRLDATPRGYYWKVDCWNPFSGDHSVIVQDLLGNVVHGNPGDILKVVRYNTLWGALNHGFDNGATLHQLTTDLFRLIDEEYRSRASGSGSLAAKQLRRRLMRLLTSVYDDSPRLRHLQMESGVSKELVAHWSEELASLERGQAQSPSGSHQPREAPQGAA